MNTPLPFGSDHSREMTIATTTMMTIAAPFEDDSNAAAAAVTANGGDEVEDHSWSQFHDEEAFVDVLEAEENDAVPAAAAAAAADDTLEQELQSQQQHQAMIVDHLPPQLHPAVSAGIRHVSSCYFSVSSEVSSVNGNIANNSGSSRMGSVADLLSLLDEAVQQEQENNNSHHLLFSQNSKSDIFPDSFSGETCSSNSPNSSSSSSNTTAGAASSGTTTDIFLNHDILMNVFTFLDAKSLAAFSETARRSNFEVFYFLQLQLQRSLLMVGSSSDHNQHQQHHNQHQQQHTAKNLLITDRSLSDIPGVASLARLAAWEPKEAQELVGLFLDSNSSLSTQHLPLSHSMAYLRQFLLRHAPATQNNQASQATMAASAALLVTLMGAASLMGQAAAAGVGGGAAEAGLPEFAAEMIPNMLKLGFVGGLMGGAAKSMSSSTTTTEQQQGATNVNNNNNNMREGAEQIATPDPYEHIPTSAECCTPTTDQPEEEEEEDQDTPEPPPQRSSSCSSSCLSPVKRKTPTGCVGAYWKVVSRASARVTQLVKDKRAANFRALPREEQEQLASALIDACRSGSSSSDSLSVVQDLIQKRACMDVDGFYASNTVGAAAGGDGVAQTCALHTAAFYGSCEILDFLCRGIDEQLCCHYAQGDGGLCNVNLQDLNGYTALHFAVMGTVMVGANNDDDSSNNNTRTVFEILVNHGADLQLETSCGYTPLQWAVRLQNHTAAKELRKQIEIQNEKKLLQRLGGGGGGWMSLPRKQHLSTIAKRFFDLVHS